MRCQAYDIDKFCTCGKVALCSINSFITPQIWFLDLANRWHFIASSFTDYFRLMTTHIGVPNWQLALTPIGMDPVSKQWLHFFVPARLEIDIEGMRQRVPLSHVMERKRDLDFLAASSNRKNTREVDNEDNSHSKSRSNSIDLLSIDSSNKKREIRKKDIRKLSATDGTLSSNQGGRTSPSEGSRSSDGAASGAKTKPTRVGSASNERRSQRNEEMATNTLRRPGSSNSIRKTGTPTYGPSSTSNVAKKIVSLVQAPTGAMGKPPMRL
jgi:hypothetical protein